MTWEFLITQNIVILYAVTRSLLTLDHLKFFVLRNLIKYLSQPNKKTDNYLMV